MPDNNPEKEAEALIKQTEKDVSQAEKAKKTYQHREELLDFCNQFVQKSGDWRRSSYETKWETYRRNADGNYDPTLAERKEGWQSKVVVPITSSHRETAMSSLVRTLLPPRPLEMKSRGTIPEEADQGDNIRDLILREMDRSRFKKEFNRVIDDATTYGSGFCRVRFAIESEMRMVRTFDLERLDVTSIGSLARHFQGERKAVASKDELQMVETYRGVKMEYLSIWDIYPDPDAFEIVGSSIAYQFQETQGDIKGRVAEGIYLPEAYATVINEGNEEEDEQHDQVRRADRQETDEAEVKTDHSSQVKMYEFFSKLPRKWVFPGDVQAGEDPDELIPAQVIFHNKAIASVLPNEAYDGEPQIYKIDYMQVAQRFYGRGICEMLVQIQEVVNETVSQRIDNVALVLNRMWVAVEQYLLNPNDFDSRPGGVIRLSKKAIEEGKSVNDVVRALDSPDVTRSSYADVQEQERYAQERTSVNRSTLGTADQVNDTNGTLGGQKINIAAMGAKMAYIGDMIEATGLTDIFRAFYRNVYANIRPEDVVNAIGPTRATTFELQTPEQIDQDYTYVPQGVFTAENRLQRQNRLMMIYQQYADQAFVDKESFFDNTMKAGDEDPESYKLDDEDMATKMMADAQMNGQAGPTDDEEGIPPEGQPQPQGPGGQPF